MKKNIFLGGGHVHMVMHEFPLISPLPLATSCSRHLLWARKSQTEVPEQSVSTKCWYKVYQQKTLAEVHWKNPNQNHKQSPEKSQETNIAKKNDDKKQNYDKSTHMTGAQWCAVDRQNPGN